MLFDHFISLGSGPRYNTWVHRAEMAMAVVLATLANNAKVPNEVWNALDKVCDEWKRVSLIIRDHFDESLKIGKCQCHIRVGHSFRDLV